MVKPLNLFADEEDPELIVFFTRPEALCGLHQLAAFVTNDPEVVASPWSAGCGSLAIWPLHFLARGKNKAVIGGWDPSARKFYKTDELSFAIPFRMFVDMVNRYVEWGAGPRASQYLILAAKALAALRGEPAVSVAHIREVSASVLRHRVLPNYNATGDGVTSKEIVERLVTVVPEPQYAASAKSPAGG